MRSAIEIDENQRNLWDRELAQFAMAHPLNAYGWSRVRAIDGWSAIHLMAKEDDRITGAVMILIKKIPILSLSIMYAPRGFVFELADNETFKALVDGVRAKAKEHRAIFFRVDPHISEAAMGAVDDPFVQAGFEHLSHRWTYWNAPRDVYRVDLAMGETEEDLFQLIDPKARTGVRKAAKEGVVIRSAESVDELRAFHAVFKRFAIEKGFLFRDLRYQESLWNEFISRGQGRLFLAVLNGEIIGGQICLMFGDLCVEMHRGVLQEHQKLRVNEALVWEGMRWAKQRGCRWYCQRGVGAGPLQKFKEKFRPQVVSLVGYYDLPFHRWIYRIITYFEFKVLPSAVHLLMRLRRRVKRLGGST